MPTLAETAPSIAEQAGERQGPNVLQPLGELAANDRLGVTPSTHEQTTGLIDATIPAPEQRIDGTVLPEMPNSHPEVDAATISVSGLIKNCPHFAEMHKNNPERAKAEAAQTTQKAQEASALREQGLSAKEIKAKMLAENLARAKEKAKAVVVEEKIKVEQKTQPVAESVPEKKLASAAQAQTRNSIQKSEPSIPMTIDRPAVVDQTIQQERQQRELLSVVASVRAADILAVVQQHPEQDTAIVRQELAAEAHISDYRVVQHIKPLLRDSVIRFEQEAVIQEEQIIVDKPQNLRLSDLPSNTVQDQKSVHAVDVDGDAHKIPAVADVSPAKFQGVIDIVDTESIDNSLVSVSDFLEMAQADNSETDRHVLSLLEIADEDVTEISTEQNTATDEWLAFRFDPEVIDTYQELLVILDKEMREMDEPNQSTVQQGDKIDPTIAETVPSEEMAQDFESFLVLQSEDEEYVSLETIIETANEQPLEQTLVRLARHLSEKLAEDKLDAMEMSTDDLPVLSDERIELNTILQEIMEILPTCYSIDEETQEKNIRITPEMTDKLLKLLNNLGYEQPSEVLLAASSLLGLGFLLQSMQYLYQLNGSNERLEFFSSARTTNSLTDENEQLRLGKLLFGLIMYKLGLNSVMSNTREAA